MMIFLMMDNDAVSGDSLKELGFNPSLYA